MRHFSQLFAAAKPIIGVIHLPPLPGFAGHPGMDALLDHALADVEVLMAQGVHGVLVENEYDRPHEVSASTEVRRAMTTITEAVVDAARDIVVGCEILLNDPRASLAVAAGCGASFIRSDYFVDRMSRPEYGEFAIDPQGLVDFRNREAAGVLILADIQVKYATLLEERTLAESARLAAICGADAVVVTGDRTGDAPRPDALEAAAAGVAASGRFIPVLIGSGLATDNAGTLLPHCSGAIVGTALMQDRKIDSRATARLMAEVRKVASA